jgi:hypothetical protein
VVDAPKFFGVEMKGEPNRFTGEMDYRCQVDEYVCQCGAYLGYDGVDHWQAVWWWADYEEWTDSEEGTGPTPQQAIAACEQKVRARVRELAEAVGLEVV